jgi:hypothetical protein
MRTFKILFIAFVAAVAFGACGNKNGKAEFEQDTTRVSGINDSDSTIYGVCGEGTAMNTLMLITDGGDTLNVITTDAVDQGQVFGGLNVGDKLALIMKRTAGSEPVAVKIINLTTLLGRWTMPNPIDGSDVQGIFIKEGGIAESINNSDKVYQSWKIFNGTLVVTSEESEFGDESQNVDTFKILSLGPDSLVVNRAGETLEFSRQK